MVCGEQHDHRRGSVGRHRKLPCGVSAGDLVGREHRRRPGVFRGWFDDHRGGRSALPDGVGEPFAGRDHCRVRKARPVECAGEQRPVAGQREELFRAVRPGGGVEPCPGAASEHAGDDGTVR